MSRKKSLLLALVTILIQVTLTTYVFEKPESFHNGLHTIATYTGYEEYYKTEISTIAKKLNVSVTYDSDKEFTLRISESGQNPRYEMPHEFPYSHTKANGENLDNLQYSVDIKENGFVVTRKSTQEVLFDTTGFDFTFSKYYIHLGTRIPSQYMYGFGERNKDFLFTTGLYTLYAKDIYIPDSGIGGKQTYGFHPVYLMREQSSNWHMAYLRTTNAMDVYFNSYDKTLYYHLTGDFIEFKFFLGDQYADTAIKLYHNYINGWAIPPFWSLGYHQTKWGYLFLDDMIDVVNNMKNHGLPLDTIWSDIEYMTDFVDFTVDSNRYKLEEFRELTKKVHWVPIIDTGVSIERNNIGFTTGNEMDVWVKSAYNNSNPLIGVVWPGLVNYPDWLSPNAGAYWQKMLKYLYDQVPFSGLWLDMNENANFCNGEYGPGRNCFELANYIPKNGHRQIDSYQLAEIPLHIPELHVHPGKQVDQSIINFHSWLLPYIPGGQYLETRTVSINALHHNNVLEFDVHNINGFLEAYLSYESVVKITHKRPFILTRSSSVGSGQFAAHWTGDNGATWENLRISIPQLFNFQLFGMPMVGPDMCGFSGDTTEELCSRWMQLGAFYPFMRNHNKIKTRLQEPYALGDTVLQTSKASLLFRYSILKFYYSLFVRNHQTGSIFRPLFFDFPHDENLLYLQNQFLIGSELMVSAVISQGATHCSVYFPAETKWFNFVTGKVVHNYNQHTNTIWAEAPYDTILPIFIRDGSIVHTQNVENVLSTVDLDNKFDLKIALKQINYKEYTANGQIMGVTNYQDDSSVDTCLGDHDCMVNISVNAVVQENQTVHLTIKFGKNKPISTLEEIYVNSLTFFGVKTDFCDKNDPFCGSGDHVVVCKNVKPSLIQYGEVSYVLTKDGCYASNEVLVA